MSINPFAFTLPIFIFIFWRAARRQAKLRAFAASMRWNFAFRDAALRTISRRPPFGRRGAKWVGPVAWGQFGSHTAMAFRCKTHAGKYPVIALRLPVSVGFVAVEPTSDAVGLRHQHEGAALQLESDEFNRRFHVRADDPKVAYDVLSPIVMQRLLASPAFAWRLDGDVLLWAQKSRGVDTSLITPVLTVLAAVADNIPQFVLHDHGATSAPASAPASIPASPAIAAPGIDVLPYGTAL